MHLDSFADFMAFGLAPAYVIYTGMMSSQRWSSDLGHAALCTCLGIYIAAAALRLARFNTYDEPTRLAGVSVIVGLPTTFAGGMSMLLFLIVQGSSGAEWIMPLVMVSLAAGMLTRLPLPKVGLRNHRVAWVAQTIGLVISFTCCILWIYPELVLTISSVYSVLSAVWLMRNWRAARRAGFGII